MSGAVLAPDIPDQGRASGWVRVRWLRPFLRGLRGDGGVTHAALPGLQSHVSGGGGHAFVRDDPGVDLRSYPRRERLTALRIARIEAVAVLVSMPTPHRTWP